MRINKKRLGTAKIEFPNRKQNTTIAMPDIVIKKMDGILPDGKCKTRSEFIRIAVSEFLQEQQETDDEVNTIVMTCNFDLESVRKMNGLVNGGLFMSRSELIRMAVLRKIRRDEMKIRGSKKEGGRDGLITPMIKVENGVETIAVSFIRDSKVVYKTYKIKQDGEEIEP